MAERLSPQRQANEEAVPAYPLEEAPNVQLIIDDDHARIPLPSARELFEQQGAPLPEEEHLEDAQDGLDGHHDVGIDGQHEHELPQWEGPPLPGDIPGASYAKRAERPKKAKKKAEKKPTSTVKTWLRIDQSGATSVLQADKWKLTQKLGIQTRDLRLLDPHMATTYPSAILCRDQSIVVNLEHIKAIITVDSVLVVNHEDQNTQKFIEELKTRLTRPGGLAASKSFASMGDLQKAAAGSVGGAAPMSLAAAAAAGAAGLGGAGAGVSLSAQLPFELRALEACLDELASVYLVLTTELESTAYPALDGLATKVTSPNLERVRRIKNRLVRLTTRVETVREVVEKFLDDDEDMHDLNLTANLERERERAEMDLDHPMHEMMGDSPDTPHLGRASVKSMVSSVSTNSSIVENEVAEVEMLLEAYFMHFDNTYNRLQTLNEYIKDTEDLVNIKLDQHRNQLISTDLILTALTCAMAMVTTISGIFGMNLNSGLQETEGVFNAVTIASSLGAIAMFVGFLVWAWRYGLIVFA